MISFQYNVFFEVATNLSFSKAAELLYITQPAVSKHIKKLEAEIGVPLFERKGNNICLTGPGEKLLDHMYKAKNLERLIQSDMDIIKSRREARGELRVGASTTISLYVLPKVFSAFHKRFPKIQLLLINRNSENILKALVNKEIDLAIIEGKYEVNSFQQSEFMEDEIIPVCSSRSPYAKSELNIDELKALPMIMRERGSGTLSVLATKLEEKGVKLGDLKIIARLGGTEALKNYLLEDEAIGFLSRLAIQRELASNTLREVKVDGLSVKRKFYFVMRKGEEEGSLIKSFKQIAAHQYNQYL